MSDLPRDCLRSETDPAPGLDDAFRHDIEAVQANPSVQTMLETVCMATGLRFAAIARVTSERWITCAVVDRLSFGLKPGDELLVETTLCHEVEQSHHEIVIDDVFADNHYCNHATPRDYGFRSYLSFPIYRDSGDFFGTLCALDTAPNRLSDQRVTSMIRLFAKLVGESIDAHQRLEDMCDGLIEERQKAEVQEQFIAILAHDLRNPVSAVDAGLRMLGRCQMDDQAGQIVHLMEGSVLRMRGLIDNLMDHARNRLSGGIVLDRSQVPGLDQTLNHIVSEFRTMSPDTAIHTDFTLTQPIDCDHARVAQLLSNLVGNAIKHGMAGQPISVRAFVEDGIFNLAVANKGKPIPQDEISSLFQPFKKGTGQPNRDGLGLGLHIAAEIARAHGGQMEVSSDPEATEFRFRMPVQPH